MRTIYDDVNPTLGNLEEMLREVNEQWGVGREDPLDRLRREHYHRMLNKPCWVCREQPDEQTGIVTHDQDAHDEHIARLRRADRRPPVAP